MRSIAGLPASGWIAPSCLLAGAAALVQVGVSSGAAEATAARARAVRALDDRVAAESVQAAERLRRIVTDTRDRGVFSDVPFPIDAAGVRWSQSNARVGNTDAFAEARRLEFVAGDAAAALAEYGRLAADPSSAVASPALREQARLLTRDGRDGDASVALHRAADLQDAPSRDVLFVLFDLARAGDADARDALIRGLAADRFVTVDPQDRLVVLEEVAPDDPQVAALRAIVVLRDQPPGSDVATVGASSVAWLLERSAATVRVALAPLPEFAAGLVPAVADGLVVATPRDGASRSPPMPSLAFAPTPRAKAAFDDAARRESRTRALPAFALAAALAAGSVFTFLHARARAQLERRKDAFLCAVTHELKTPVANVLLYAETLREHGAADPGRIPEFTGVIASEALRLEARVAEILEVASGRESVPRGVERFDAMTIVRDVVASLGAGAVARGIGIETRIAAGPVHVGGSSRALRRALAAVVDNAIVHVAKGTIVVAAARDAGKLRIVVEDAGPGIPPAERERVFEPFVRLGDERTRAVPGTGLGLTLARQGVEACGGTIRAEGRDGPGARFVLEIPEV